MKAFVDHRNSYHGNKPGVTHESILRKFSAENNFIACFIVDSFQVKTTMDGLTHLIYRLFFFTTIYSYPMYTWALQKIKRSVDKTGKPMATLAQSGGSTVSGKNNFI